MRWTRRSHSCRRAIGTENAFHISPHLLSGGVLVVSGNRFGFESEGLTRQPDQTAGTAEVEIEIEREFPPWGELPV